MLLAMSLLIAVHLIDLTGPDGQRIELNSDQVVSMRLPRHSEHFARGTRCLITTVDGKQLTVQEECNAVQRLIEQQHGR